MPLNERERAILDFESSCRLRGWAKEEQIRQSLGMSPARYYQLLVRMLDSVEAQAYDPLLMGRLRRLRERDRGGIRSGASSADSAGRTRTISVGGIGTIV